MNKVHEFVRKNLCKILQVGYHLLFIGSMTGAGSYYLSEFEKTRDEALSEVKKIRESIDKASDSVYTSQEKIVKELSKVKKACDKLF